MSTTHFGEISIFKSDTVWTLDVKDFVTKKKGEYLESPVFVTTDTDQLKYSLLFYPKGTMSSSNSYIGLFLINKNDFEVSFDYLKLSLMTNKNVKTNKKELMNIIFSSNEGVGESDFIQECKLYSPAKELINNNKITIVCLIMGDFELAGILEKQKDLVEVNKKLFTNNIHSDITIKCNEKEFNLNKCILANRSSVFEAMLKSDMVEKERNVIEINDTDSDVLYQFFKYLYTNTVDNFKKIAKDLMVVADKYLVSDLKDECGKVLGDGINSVNAIEYLKIADVHSDYHLRSKAIEYIARHITKFTNKPEFESLDQKKLLEIINMVAYYMKENIQI